eukprot:PhF_6_TR6897/c1_g2_i2/m.10000
MCFYQSLRRCFVMQRKKMANPEDLSKFAVTGIFNRLMTEVGTNEQYCETVVRVAHYLCTRFPGNESIRKRVVERLQKAFPHNRDVYYLQIELFQTWTNADEARSTFTKCFDDAAEHFLRAHFRKDKDVLPNARSFLQRITREWSRFEVIVADIGIDGWLDAKEAMMKIIQTKDVQGWCMLIADNAKFEEKRKTSAATPMNSSDKAKFEEKPVAAPHCVEVPPPLAAPKHKKPPPAPPLPMVVQSPDRSLFMKCFPPNITEEQLVQWIGMPMES